MILALLALVCRLRGHDPLAGRICARCLRPIRWFNGRWWLA